MTGVSEKVCSAIHEHQDRRLQNFEDKLDKVAEDVAFIRGNMSSNKSWVSGIISAIAVLIAWFK